MLSDSSTNSLNDTLQDMVLIMIQGLFLYCEVDLIFVKDYELIQLDRIGSIFTLAKKGSVTNDTSQDPVTKT